MSFFATASRVLVFSIFAMGFLTPGAQALDLDWHGQFRGETNTLFNYSNGTGSTGYTIPNNGENPASFQNLFLSLKPRVLVNDNISLYSNIWFGAPDTGLFGANGSTKHLNVSNAGTSTLSAEALYGEFATDFGTFRVGRVPLHYGLGLVWNNDSNGFNRLPSNGDAISLVTKFGAFKFMPSFIKYQNCNVNNGVCTGLGNAGVNDYTLSLAYANDDEQLDVSLLFMRRLAGLNASYQNPFSTGTTTSGFAYNLFDFYAKKRAGIFTLKAEVPFASGLIAGNSYSTVAGAVNADADLGEHWKLKLNAGAANGQAGGTTTSLTAFYFNPDYRPGFLMFNYNYRNIANSTGSPYDSPITNTRFLALSGEFATGKFTHELKWLYAFADQVADGSTNPYFNTIDGHLETPTATSSAQSKDLGFEVDYRLDYEWDEALKFGMNLGLYLPGEYYSYSAAGTQNSRGSVFGANLNMMVKF